MGRADTATGHRWITDRQGRALVLRGLSTANSAKQAADGMPWIAEKDVLLDMHQDLYGPRVGGNGAPAWATEMDGLASAPTDPWELGYAEPGTVRAFDRFWGTVEGGGRDLRKHYVGALREVARRFADDDTVIGYDLMNEPWGGSVQGPAFESGPLARLYQDGIEVPVVIGEFGLDVGLPGAMAYVEKAQRMADDMGAGFAYWSNDNGNWAPWNAKSRTLTVGSGPGAHSVRITPRG
ncbi:hypothetical protein [Streptomyces sp. NPDC029674]|uniref:hypothetical protein n=1 Tax=Streptomyces sp. NPDC029674 TaxID=3365297 RepID=UPI00384CC7BC